MKTKLQLSSRGQGLVEFALILPILLVFIMLIVDLSRVAYVFSAVNNAAREGARFAVARPNTTQSQIADEARRMTGGIPVSVSSNPILLTTTTDVVEVTVSHNFEPSSFILQWLTGDNGMLLRGRASMQVEW